MRTAVKKKEVAQPDDPRAEPGFMAETTLVDFREEQYFS